MISCHGIDESIITSDYGLINKEYIHRIFSAKNAKTRRIPRIFIFDCCSGDNQRDTNLRQTLDSTGHESEYESSEEEEERKQTPELLTVSKNVKIKSLSETSKQTGTGRRTTTITIETEMEVGKNNWRGSGPERVESVIWARDEDNPDYRLMVVNAANSGFQSKMSCETGSYVVQQLMQRLEDNIINNNNKDFLFKILSSIQNELHDSGKQLLTYSCNNNTGYIKFSINDNDLTDYYDNQQKGLMDGLIFGDNDLKLALDKYFINDTIKSHEMFEFLKQNKEGVSTDNKQESTNDDEKKIWN